MIGSQWMKRQGRQDRDQNRDSNYTIPNNLMSNVEWISLYSHTGSPCLRILNGTSQASGH